MYIDNIYLSLHQSYGVSSSNKYFAASMNCSGGSGVRRARAGDTIPHVETVDRFHGDPAQERHRGETPVEIRDALHRRRRCGHFLHKFPRRGPIRPGRVHQGIHSCGGRPARRRRGKASAYALLQISHQFQQEELSESCSYIIYTLSSYTCTSDFPLKISPIVSAITKIEFSAFAKAEILASDFFHVFLDRAISKIPQNQQISRKSRESDAPSSRYTTDDLLIILLSHSHPGKHNRTLTDEPIDATGQEKRDR